MGPGTLFAWGHDVHLLPDGDLSEFDDGAVPRIHSQSRGMIIHVDPTTGTATLVREYDHPKPLLTGSQGNYQTLDNGDAFLGWGAVPYFSEFSPDGRLLFDAKMPSGYQSYRAYRAQWVGTPPRDPDLAGSRGPHNALTLYASWNGATNVVAWQVSEGSSGSLRAGPTFARTGFETTMAVVSSARYVAVRALSPFGKVLGTSGARQAVTRRLCRRAASSPSLVLEPTGGASQERSAARCSERGRKSSWPGMGSRSAGGFSQTQRGQGWRCCARWRRRWPFTDLLVAVAERRASRIVPAGLIWAAKASRNQDRCR